MRKSFLIPITVAALTASAAFAQGQSGGTPGAGRGMGGGVGNPMGAGAPAGVPGWGNDPRTAGRGVADSRGSFGRDFAQQRQLTQAEQAQLLRDRADDLRTQSADRRAAAFALRDEMRAGHASSESAGDIRRDLRKDMEEWRDAFQIGRQDWNNQRDEWLVDRDSLTPQEWAERRAFWFEVRDAWISQQVDRAQSMANKGSGSDTGEGSEAGG